MVDDSHITASPYFDIPSSENERSVDANNAEQNEAQEAKPKSRIAAEILANGYMLQDHVVAKGVEYDNKYNLTSRFTGFLGNLQSNGNYIGVCVCFSYFFFFFFLAKQFDSKYRIWDNVKNIDQKYKISEKAQTAAQTAQVRAQAALQTPTGQKVHDFANQTLAQIAAVHYEAKKIHVKFFLKKKKRNI